LKAAEHFDQKLSRLDGAAAYRLADLGQHLDLETIRCADHADETGDLNHTTPSTLGQAQPRSLALLISTEL
jgi:hypothetical protein